MKNTLYKPDAKKYITSGLPIPHTPSINSLSASVREFCPKDEMFLNYIAHELRTPINVVLGSIQLFEMMGEDLFIRSNHGKFKVYNNIMKQNCYRLLRVVNNLIDVSRLESNNFCLFLANHDIVGIVREIVESAKPYAEKKGLTLKFKSGIKELVTVFDEDKLSRVIINLLSNAIKFTPEGGTIKVEISLKQDKVYISVKDTGTGIPSDLLDKIFKPFFQVDKSLSRNHEGGGLGLYLAESIVKLHDGSITVKSKPKKGSTFIVALPVKKMEQEPSDNEGKDSGRELYLSPADKVKIELSDLF
mgnify:CR=1 FL=1